MHNTREKLIELLFEMSEKLQTQGGVTWYDFADHLIANGVTVQQWIPVSEPPKEDERVIVWVGKNRYNDLRKDTDRIHNGRWVRWGNCVTRWMPFPEPPEGE